MAQGRIAQLVEQGIENPRVGGSTPSPATAHTLLFVALLAAAAGGCGDRCQSLCVSVADRVQTCRPESITWADLGAKSRSDFVGACQVAWDRTRLSLSANDLRLALEDCQAANKEVDTLSCDEIIALYGPAN